MPNQLDLGPPCACTGPCMEALITHAHDFPMLPPAFAINRAAYLHQKPTLRRLICCRNQSKPHSKGIVQFHFHFSDPIFNFIGWLLDLKFLGLASSSSQEQTAIKNCEESCSIDLHFRGGCSNFFQSKLIDYCLFLVFIGLAEVLSSEAFELCL
jgi:hypothetical protein